MVMMSVTGVLVSTSVSRAIRDNHLLRESVIFQLVIKLHDYAEAMRFGALCASQVVHLYFHTLPGQKLIDYSTSISQYTLVGQLILKLILLLVELIL